MSKTNQPRGAQAEGIRLSHSRSQAIVDGDLVDVTEASKMHRIKSPVDLTRAVYERCVVVPSNHTGTQNAPERLDEILWALSHCISNADDGDTSTLCFSYQVMDFQTGRYVDVRIRAIGTTGDFGETVAAVMLFEEDPNAWRRLACASSA